MNLLNFLPNKYLKDIRGVTERYDPVPLITAGSISMIVLLLLATSYCLVLPQEKEQQPLLLLTIYSTYLVGVLFFFVVFSTTLLSQFKNSDVYLQSMQDEEEEYIKYIIKDILYYCFIFSLIFLPVIFFLMVTFSVIGFQKIHEMFTGGLTEIVYKRLEKKTRERRTEDKIKGTKYTD